VIIRKPIVKRRWKKKRLVQIVGTEALTHGDILKADAENADRAGVGSIYPRQTAMRFDLLEVRATIR
jgi:hypothetical protein